MTSTSKKLIVGLFLFALAMPAYAHEESTDDKNTIERKRFEQLKNKDSEEKRPKDAQACLRLEQGADGIKKRLEGKRSEWQERKTNRRDELITRKGNGREKLDTFRGEADGNREELIAKLLEKYPDADDQAAINAFEAQIEAAVAKRRAAIDAALTAYLQGVQDTLGSRQDKMASALATMKASIEAAMTQAKADCASGVDKQTVFQTLQASIKAAREKFAADRKASEATSTELEALKKTRETAIKAAIETFKTEAKTARDTLKAALGEPETSEDSNE